MIRFTCVHPQRSHNRHHTQGSATLMSGYVGLCFHPRRIHQTDASETTTAVVNAVLRQLENRSACQAQLTSTLLKSAALLLVLLLALLSPLHSDTLVNLLRIHEHRGEGGPWGTFKLNLRILGVPICTYLHLNRGCVLNAGSTYVHIYLYTSRNDFGEEKYAHFST